MADHDDHGDMPPRPPKPPRAPEPPEPPRAPRPPEPPFGEDAEFEEIEDYSDGAPRDAHFEFEFDSERFFGRDGPFGDKGVFGPDGPFGANGPFGPKGVFGPGGVFAKSAKFSRGFERPRGEGRRGQHRHPGARRSRTFGPGELRLLLLAMLAEEPRHGYELIKALEQMTEGAYAPSPGVIYPTLQMLADEGAIAEQASDDAKKLYQATDAGIAELEDRKDEIEALWQRLGRKTERARPAGGSSDLKRAFGNLAQVVGNKARSGGLQNLDKDRIVDLIDEVARKIERL